MLTIFGDESADSIHQKAFAVAGLLGDEPQWTALRKNWKERTGGKVFHASDCECDQNDFKDTPHADNLSLYKDLTTILAKSGLMGFGAAIDLVGLRKYFSDTREENPYLSCFLRTVKYLGERAQQCIPSYQVEVIFDQHPTNEYNAGLIYQYLRMNHDWDVGALFAEKVSFTSRKEIGIQAADLWAREIMKELENRIDSRPRRKSMLALQETHLFGADILLEGFYRGMRDNYVKLSHELEMRPADYAKWLNNRQDNESNRILYMMFTEDVYQATKSSRTHKDENSKDETARGNL